MQTTPNQTTCTSTQAACTAHTRGESILYIYGFNPFPPTENAT